MAPLFGGNPIAAAVAVTALEVVRDEQLADRAYRLGTDIPGRDEKTVRNISCGFFGPGQGIAECVDNQ